MAVLMQVSIVQGRNMALFINFKIIICRMKKIFFFCYICVREWKLPRNAIAKTANLWTNCSLIAGDSLFVSTFPYPCLTYLLNLVYAALILQDVLVNRQLHGQVSILNQNAITKAVPQSETPVEEYHNTSAWAVMRTTRESQEYLPDILKRCCLMTREYIPQRADLVSRVYYS